VGTISRTTWTDDDGTGRTGSIISNAELQAIYDAVEGDIKSASNPTVTTKSVQDNVIAGVPVISFGGDPNAIFSNTAIVSGSTNAACHEGTRQRTFDSALVAGGSYRLRGMTASAGGGTCTLGVYNLTDSPNASPIATITSGTDDVGTERSSGVITFPAPGTGKTYGIKPLVSGAGVEGSAWALELVRTA
jgi:hypothetical protein